MAAYRLIDAARAGVLTIFRVFAYAAPRLGANAHATRSQR